MMMMALFGAVFLWMAFAMSTPEARRAARARQHPWDKIAGALALALALAMILGA